MLNFRTKWRLVHVDGLHVNHDAGNKLGVGLRRTPGHPKTQHASKLRFRSGLAPEREDACKPMIAVVTPILWRVRCC